MRKFEIFGRRKISWKMSKSGKGSLKKYILQKMIWNKQLWHYKWGRNYYYSLAPISFYGQISRERLRLCPLTSANFSKIVVRHVTSYVRLGMGRMNCESDCILPFYNNFILASRCSSALVDRSKLLPRRVFSFLCPCGDPVRGSHGPDSGATKGNRVTKVNP